MLFFVAHSPIPIQTKVTFMIFTIWSILNLENYSEEAHKNYHAFRNFNISALLNYKYTLQYLPK